MVNRRFAQVSTSDEEDEDIQPLRRMTRNTNSNSNGKQMKRKKIKLDLEEEEEDEGEEEQEILARMNDRKKIRKLEEEEKTEEEEEEVEQPEDAKPSGEPVRVSGKGRGRKSHYEAFEFDGNRYELEDPVLLVPEVKKQKPYVAIIKDITQNRNGNMMVTGQWFYRPGEAERKGGGSWPSCDTRELFYSFHRDDVPAESVMHKCVVHFVPVHKQLPKRKQDPGFIVQKVYDTVEQKLWKLTDKDYEDNKQHEIDILVQKTMSRLRDLPDIETDGTAPDQEEQSNLKRSLRKKNLPPLDVTMEEETTDRSDQTVKAETPGSCLNIASEYYSILVKFKALTGENHRDKWLERLLQGVQSICTSPGEVQVDDKSNGSNVSNVKSPRTDTNRLGDEDKSTVTETNTEKDDKSQTTEFKRLDRSPRVENGSQEKSLEPEKLFTWPDAAVSVVIALEQASHDALSSDFQKYNQKLRQLVFNLKNNSLLARRLLSGELGPTKILSMSPTELKEGFTAEEITTNEPEEAERMQMTDARCSRCMEFKVGVRDIIQAGHGDRYQLECIGCGHSWYASRDEASRLTIGWSSTTKSVDTEQLVTVKSEHVDKKVASTEKTEKLADDVL